MRTFVKLRKVLVGHEELARRLDELAGKQGEQSEQIQYIFNTINQLTDPQEPDTPRRQIGFPAGA